MNMTATTNMTTPATRPQVLRARCSAGLLAALALLTFWGAPETGIASTADTSRCHAIQNADQRHLCLALGKRDPARCHSIHDADSRHGCLAQTQEQRSRCHSIQNRDQREMCLALVPRG